MKSAIGILFLALGIVPALADEPKDREKLREALSEREKESWELLKNRDVKAMRAFYPDDLVMISGDGSKYGNAEFLKIAPDIKLDGYDIQGKPELVVLTPDAAVLVYRVTYTMAYKDEKPKKVTVLSSSTYARRDGKWLLVFNQETAAK